jgi:hypothetical protein
MSYIIKDDKSTTFCEVTYHIVQLYLHIFDAYPLLLLEDQHLADQVLHPQA